MSERDLVGTRHTNFIWHPPRSHCAIAEDRQQVAGMSNSSVDTLYQSHIVGMTASHEALQDLVVLVEVVMEPMEFEVFCNLSCHICICHTVGEEDAIRLRDRIR